MGLQVNISVIARCRGPFLPLILLCFLVFNNLSAQEIDYRAQSLFIYKFTKYIYWPEEKASGNFLIGVYGNSAIIEELETMASLKKGGNDQDIIVQQFSDLEGIEDVHILYVASSRSRDIGNISEKLRAGTTLVVAERSGLARKGAAISFLIMDDGTLKFEINMDNLRKHRLEISKELLNLGFEI